MSSTKVITGKNTRFSYANVWEPKGFKNNTPKYSVSLIIPKSDKVTVKKIEEAIKAAYEEGADRLKGKNGKVPPLASLDSPLRDGDVEKDDESYVDAYYVNAKSVTAPGIVDADCNPILNKSEFYSGCYGRASINFYAYSVEGGRGIACGLNNLQKLRDGAPLGGRASAEADFSDFEDDDDFLD